jgi:hypothetical protein
MSNAELRNDWVLHLDADEVVTPQLREELKRSLSMVDPGTVAFRMCRKTMLGKSWLKYSDGFPVWIMRLVRRNKAGFHDSGHGEVAVPNVEGTMSTIQEPFLHYAFSKGWADWIQRHNRYSSREAELEAVTRHKIKLRGFFSMDRAIRRSNLRQLSRRLPFRAIVRFLYQYVFKLGFLDGQAGLTFCIMMATYEGWIVLKRYEIETSGEYP